jgi:hypothetical protein
VNGEPRCANTFIMLGAISLMIQERISHAYLNQILEFIYIWAWGLFIGFGIFFINIDYRHIVERSFEDLYFNFILPLTSCPYLRCLFLL